MRRPANNANTLVLAAVGCIAGAFIIRALLISFLKINEDEFIHLYWAWATSQGMIPFRDFMMVHTPLPQMLLAPLFWIFRDQISIIFVTRVLFSLFSAGTLFFTFLLAKRIFGKESALFALVAALPVAIFTQKSVEVRPDQIAALFGMIALWLLAKTRPRFFMAGLMCGLALVTNQKFIFMTLLLVPGVWLAIEGRATKRLKNTGAFIVATILPVIVFIIWLALVGAAGAFYRDNYHVYMWGGNFASKAGAGLNVDRWDFFGELLFQNPTFFLFFIIGATFLLQKRLPKASRFAIRPLLFYFAGLLALYGLTLSHEKQNSLYLVPLCAIIAGHGARNLYLKLARKEELRTRKLILIVLILVLVSPSLFAMRYLMDKTNDEQLRTWKYILETVPKGQTVMDGHAGMFVYRENALFYHPTAFFDAREILYSFFDSKEAMEKYFDTLLTQKRPKIIILEDVFEKVLPESTVRKIKENYTLVEGYAQPLYVLH